LWNWRWGGVFLVTLTLLWHETDAPQWAWINLIAIIALLRVVSDVKRLRRSLEVYRAISALALVLLLIPFSVAQIRAAIYPQLEYPARPIESYPEQPAPRAQSPAMPQEALKQELDRGMPASRERKATTFAEAMDSVVSSTPYRYPLASVDPNAKLQTGPGLPQWQWNAIRLSWNGPVQPQQTVEIVYLSPMVNAILNWLRVALALLLAWRLIRVSMPGKGQAGLPALGAVTLLPLVLLSAAPDARAEYPPAGLLNELEQRLLQAPQCLPGCVTVPRGRLSVSADDILQMRLQIQVADTLAVPLPGRAGHWEPRVVSVDGELPPLTRGDDGTLYVVLEQGVHALVIRGTLAGMNAVQLHFPLPPKQLETDVQAWDVTGFREPGIPGPQIQLTRVTPGGGDETAWDPVTVPPFVILDKTFRIGLDWEIASRVTRVTPPGKSIVLRVPLQDNETLLTEGIPIRDGFAEVTLGPDQASFDWHSRLEKTTSLTLQAADSDLWTEVWHFEASPIWHVDYEGIPPIHHTSRDNRWLPTWHPWPGESLIASISRPEGIPGNTVTIQSSSLAVQPGQRATDARLDLAVRSSQGTRRRILIPDGAELLSVSIDGKSQPIRQEGGEVIIPLRPGAQDIEVKWRGSDAVDTLTETPAIDLGGPHVNASLQMSLGRDRWILWTRGPAMGPAVLFWGVLIVIVLVALALGRLRQTPLKTWQWALLGVGLSQVPLPFAAVVVAWFFVMAYRGRGDMPDGALKFNAIQIGLALMTLFVVGAVVAAVQKGLLGWPNMLITGNQSSAYQFNWYQDRWGEGYPRASVVSLPLIVYRLLMLAWALWLAFSSVNWLRWGWRQYTAGGLYRPWQRKSGKRGATQSGSGKPSGATPDDL
jgi:hypothetical protein